MASEDELLAKLSRWLKTQTGPISVVTTMETGDSELVAAYVLVMFRAAARQAVVDRFAQVAGSTALDAPDQSTNVVLRLFDGIARAWKLTDREAQGILGLREPGELAPLRTLSEADVAIELIERIAILLDIFTAINAILPTPAHADGWIRRPNKSPLFGGQSALDLIAERGLEGMRSVRSYLWSQF